MRISQKASSPLSISYVLTSLLICLFESASARLGGQICNPSFCGDLNITYPLRLQTDPAECGVTAYQLICDDQNRTVLNVNTGKYYISEIEYKSNSIGITDVGLASGQCGLPAGSLTPDFQVLRNEFDPSYEPEKLFGEPYYGPFLVPTFGWVTFVNCTRELQLQRNKSTLLPTDDVVYCPMPCLRRNNSWVYAMNSSRIGDLPPSCGFLAMVPYDFDQWADSEAEAFELLKKALYLPWREPRTRMIPYCYAQASRNFKYRGGKPAWHWYNIVYSIVWRIHKFELYFLQCVHNYHLQNIVAFRIAAVMIVLLDIALILLMIAILCRFVFAPLMVLGYLGSEFWKTRVPIDVVEKFLQNQQTLTPTRYTYTDILAMTRHFKEKLGQGGFGSVYKGELPGGFHVAVKMLGNSKCNGDDFISEVSTIGRIHHVNIVRLVGFSSEGSKRALIYEYLPKGSLDKYIFSSDKSNINQGRTFTWAKLNEIALGVARGINYLHRGCDMRILHFDIKPHNILLDNCFNPKVSDFGLAKLYPKDYSIVSMSAARGTIGYIAPELISRSFGVISYKSDVYSFGMLLLEMAGGRRNVEPKAENTSQIYYPSWIFDQLNKREVHEIVDVAAIGENERKLCIVGLWCIQTKPSDRPSMSEVVEMLEGDVGTLQMPPKPFLSSPPPMSIRESRMEPSSIGLSIISEHESIP